MSIKPAGIDMVKMQFLPDPFVHIAHGRELRTSRKTRFQRIRSLVVPRRQGKNAGRHSPTDLCPPINPFWRFSFGRPA
jgi:hypothetical protein